MNIVNWLRLYNFRMHVQSEVKAQTGNQNMVFRLCNSTEALNSIKNFYSFLRTQYDYTAGGGAFMTLFPLYTLALKNQDFSLAEKKLIATWINDADARAKRDMRFYTTYAQIFLSAQHAMHDFCLQSNLDPDELITKH